MNTPILDRLKKLKRDNNISFHTPGHKGKNTLINWGDYIPHIDTTEIFGTDNLHDPKGIIKESQELAAKAFGAKETLYSINGTTGGIYIALGTVTKPGDKVLIQRDSHRSIYNGIILNRLNVEYIYPNYNEKYKILTGIDPEAIESKLKRDKDIKVVALVYPNYYGICSHIEKIAEIVHKYNRILLVDEAHGSHFAFSDKLPISALKAGADITIQSTHKTLPSFTQTSMVHVGTDRVNINKLKTISSLYQSTSPSYLFMLSLEIARAYMEGEGSLRLDKTINILCESIKTLQNIERVHVFTGDKEDKTIYDKDITKILFRLEGMAGTRVNEILREDYNIFLEMADYYYALALVSLMNEKGDFKKLIRSMENIAQKEPFTKIEDININLITPKNVLPIYEAFYSNKKIIDLNESVGKVSASFITPYPPGIPIICPGEEITKELEEQIRFLLGKNIEIIGLIGYNKEKIEVVD
ncbi:MAG: aminotransferase class I/II-fold pyridoxal phosphate-dependent enzyme [Tissierellia bacterium]|nr:aminotransferase class I/II-fold pyridoxal phosphate-dependent enzyme [Tissierellia bacterium]